MNKELSKTARKSWITVNFLSLVLIVFFFYLGRGLGKPVIFFIGSGISLMVVVYTFIRVFIQTGLWKMIHGGQSQLDERQTWVVLQAIKFSYSIFTILVLLIVYGFAVLNLGVIHVLVAACLLYLAHVLPAVIIGWKEKFV